MLLAVKQSAIYLVTVMWIVSWLLAIPLFHIHALDVQEIPLSSNSFLAHTVFSGDLPGEYTSGFEQHSASDSQRTVESHYPRYREIDFVTFVEADDDIERGPGNQPLLYDEWNCRFLLSATDKTLIFERSASPPLRYLSSVASRAPPSMS
ncbi:MAG: hypothetical protein KIT40_02425 [Nitrospira sp.]|nr:hypothetical protein [Nitrospira sp.]